MIKLTFILELQSDYHISAGHGLASEADSALLRDGDGVPVLRGTTLTGLLRDGLWRLMQLEPLKPLQACQASGLPEKDQYCGQFDPDAEDCPICRLFGTPRTIKHWRIHSARPVGQKTIFSRPQTEKDRQIVQRVRVDPSTRRAEPRKLFSQEDGAAHLTFEFTVTCPASSPEVMDEAALLVAAARMVRQLGRSRRRGQGECLFKLKAVEGIDGCPADGEAAQAALLAHFKKRWLEGQKGTAHVIVPSSASSPTKIESTRFRLVVRADEPLLIAQRAEAGNQFESRPFITGAAVRGALAWLAARRNGLDPTQNPDYHESPVYQDFVDVFVRDGVHFPCLYPGRYENRMVYPTVPAPLDWLTCKVFPGLDGGSHGAVQYKDVTQQRCPHCDEPLNPLKDFISLELVPRKYKPKWRHEMHIRVRPETGRVAQGDLFTYVALEAGQYFVGELTAQDAAAWAHFFALTGLPVGKPFHLHLGKASRRGYGHVTAWLQPLNDESLTWVQLPIAQRVPDANGLITLTLLTDAILPDTWGRSATDLGDCLLDWVDLPLTVVDSFSRVQAVDGFNAHLGLPRWRDQALAAGSVAYIRRKEGANWPDDWQSQLAQAEREGVGLRRNEGFGRIAFNHPLYWLDGSMQRSAIKLPDKMWLAPGLHSDDFQEEWRETLDRYTDQMSKRCQDAPFGAVARWLYARRDKDPAKLKTKLKTLGVPDDDLKQAINQGQESRSCTGKDEYGDRDKPNRLIKKLERLEPGELEAEERQKEGLGLLYALLEKLAGYDPTHRPTGIEMLADWLAGLAEKGEEA